MIWKALLIVFILSSLSCTSASPKLSHAPAAFTHSQVADVPADYPTIQDAINKAADGDTIFIHEGSYIENVVVNKTVSLIGENREKTKIDGNNSGIAVRIVAENVSVRNLTIQHGGSSPYESGIFLNASFGNITDNYVIDNNLFGICLNQSSGNFISGNLITQNKGDGIILFHSSRNALLENIISGNDFGIRLNASPQNKILNNTLVDNRLGGINLFFSAENSLVNNNVTRNAENGIILDFSSDNNALRGNTIVATEGYGLTLGSNFNTTLRDNRLDDNTYNFYCPPVRPNLSDYLNNIDESNTVNGKQIQYIVGKDGLRLDPSTFNNVGYLALVNCTNMIVQDLGLSENGQGLLLAFTNSSIIKNFTATKNNHGVQLISSVNNNVQDSSLIGNSGDGLTLDYSSNKNTVSSNMIQDNYNGIRMIHNTDGNNLTDNFITNNTKGFWIYSFNIQNTIKNNIIIYNLQGIAMSRGCKNNTITQNTIDSNNEGINFSGSSQNLISYNNFINNTTPVVNLDSTNLWDIGYPGGGNFWSDYVGVDAYWGPSQDKPGSDGIGDTPYTIDSQNTDKYPILTILNATEDHDPPFVEPPSHTPEDEIELGQEVKVSITVLDRESGVKNVTLWYSVGNGSISYQLTTQYNASSNHYETVIPGQQAVTQVKYKITAFDEAGNKAEQDNSGQYYTYQVIPEYTATLALIIFFALAAAAVLCSRKVSRDNLTKSKQRAIQMTP